MRRSLLVVPALLLLALAGCLDTDVCPNPIRVTTQGDTIFLQWGHSANTTGFEIARSLDDGPLQHNYGFAPNANHPSFTDTNVTTGHTYHYRVVSQGNPAEVCAPVDGRLPDAQVPFVTGIGAWAAAFGGAAVVALVLRRKM